MVAGGMVAVTLAAIGIYIAYIARLWHRALEA